MNAWCMRKRKIYITVNTDFSCGIVKCIEMDSKVKKTNAWCTRKRQIYNILNTDFSCSQMHLKGFKGNENECMVHAETVNLH